MSNENQRKFTLHPTHIPSVILLVIFCGFFTYFLFFKRSFLILERLAPWGFLLVGLTFAITGLIGIIKREFPMKGGVIYRNGEAVAMGIMFMVLGLATGIGLFLTW